MLSYFPTGFQLAGLLAVLALALAFSLLGRVAAGRGRLAEADLVCGWGACAGVFTLSGVLTDAPFAGIALILVVLASGAGWASWRREGGILAGGAARILVLALPLLVVVSAMAASQWDEFSQWLLSARHLIDHGDLPDRASADTGASVPARPYAMPLVTYLASRLAGGFVENAGALFNVVLLMALALVVLRLVVDELGVARGWGLCALAFLAVTLLSPTFVLKLALTAYADNATSVAAGTAAVLGWMALRAAGDGARTRARTLAWQAGLVLGLLVVLKEGNAGLVAALGAGIGIAALRDPRLRISEALRHAPAVVGPAMLLWGAWELYVRSEIPGTGFPDAEAVPHLIPEILASMLSVVAHKGHYFGPMAGFVALAARSLWRMESPFDRLVVIAATSFLAYNLFLFVAYVVVFGDDNARQATSYWRFNTHLGGILVVTAAHGLAVLVRRHAAGWRFRRLALVAVFLVVLAPLVMAPKLRFDRHAAKSHVRAVAIQIAGRLGPDARLMVIDPLDTGVYARFVHYEMQVRTGRGIVGGVDASHRTAERVRALIARFDPTHIWVHTQTAAVREALGQVLPAGASYLLVRDGETWKLEKRWLYPGYRVPQEAGK